MKTAFILILGFGGLATVTCNSSKSKQAEITKPTLPAKINELDKVALFGPFILKPRIV
jgi:hypothetical protein